MSMDPGTYIAILGATVQAIHICGDLKKALRGHKESKQTLDELEGLLLVFKGNLDENAVAPPTLLGIVQDLQKFHQEYKSAGVPGIGLGQIVNRIRLLVFNEESLKKKYDRLMIHMTSEIYAYVCFPHSFLPLDKSPTYDLY